MIGIVLFSHGSLLCGAGAALEAHAERLRRDYGFPLVEVGYLNYSEPLFADSVEKLASAGATRIVVVPFFLAPGYFVTHSLPKCVEPAQQAHPGIEFLVAPPLGADSRIADAVLESAGAAQACEHWRDGLLAAGAACRSNHECPVYGKYACAAPTLSPSPNNEGRGIKKVGSAPVPPPRYWGEDGKARRGAIWGKVPEGRDGGQTRGSGNEPGELAPPSRVGKGAGGLGVRPEGGRGVRPVDCLLIMIHGSPKPEANDEMFQVIEMVKARRAYPIVQVGFLECNEPAIPKAIESCIAQGAQRIVAVPYFLHTGAHVAEDLPAILDEARENHIGIGFLLGEHIGNSAILTGLLAERAREGGRLHF